MKKRLIILIGLILLKFILGYLIFNSSYDLHRDEYLHLDQAHHLAWGYQSIPPFTSWVAHLIKMLGNGVFWVKFFPALFGALTMLVVWKAIEELKGNLFALILGTSCVLFSALLKINFLFQPNSFDVLCWTTFYYILLKYINSENVKWLFSLAFVFALGFLNKYNIIFLVIGLLPAILLSEHRKVFAKKELYLAFGLALALISPNVWWQYQNDFPVFHHMKELAATQLVNVNRIDFLKEQLLYFFAALPVLIAALYALLFHQPFKKYRLFLWSLIFSLIIFSYFKAKGYYAIGIYPIYFAFGAVFLSSILEGNRKKYLQPILIALPILFNILLFNVIVVKSPEYYIEKHNKFKKLGMLRWEDGKVHRLPQDYADMLGWKELAQIIDQAIYKLPYKKQTIILCDNYGQAGAINYYSKNKSIKAVSFNADYINWFNLDTKIENLISVKEFDGANAEFLKISPYFEKAYKADSIKNQYAREVGTTVLVFSNPKIDINEVLRQELMQRKAIYNKTKN